MDSVRAHMADVEVVCDCLCGVVVEGEEGDELRSGKKGLTLQRADSTMPYLRRPQHLCPGRRW